VVPYKVLPAAYYEDSYELPATCYALPTKCYVLPARCLPLLPAAYYALPCYRVLCSLCYVPVYQRDSPRTRPSAAQQDDLNARVYCVFARPLSAAIDLW
jgi:hypothetical protein